MRTACAVPGGKPRKVTHLGGENGVTGSCHLLQANGLNILVDCGAARAHAAGCHELLAQRVLAERLRGLGYNI
jgi:predicted metal-dependent RNase